MSQSCSRTVRSSKYIVFERKFNQILPRFFEHILKAMQATNPEASPPRRSAGAARAPPPHRRRRHAPLRPRQRRRGQSGRPRQRARRTVRLSARREAQAGGHGRDGRATRAFGPNPIGLLLQLPPAAALHGGAALLRAPLPHPGAGGHSQRLHAQSASIFVGKAMENTTFSTCLYDE